MIDGIDVEAIVLTNRHHLRDSERLAGGERSLLAPAAGLDGREQLRTYALALADTTG